MKLINGLIAFLMMIGSQVSAFDTADLQKLNDTGNCVACDLEGADLTGAYLRNVILTRSNLRNVNLSGANLKAADLGYALMNGAILCNTIMPDGSVIYSGC